VGVEGGVLLGFRGLLPLSEIKAVKKAATRTPNPGLYNVYNLKICNEIYKPFGLYLHRYINHLVCIYTYLILSS